jgi:hypothetical protein
MLKTASWVAIFLAGALCGLAASFVLVPKENAERDTDIVFPISNGVSFSDAYVFVRGTLTGEGVPYKNNAVEIYCEKSEMRCDAFHVEQIAVNQIGDLDPPLIFSVSSWQPSLIVATDDQTTMSGYPSDCIRSTLNIERTSAQPSAEWIEEPINPELPLCKNTPTAVRKWTVENPAFWKR